MNDISPPDTGSAPLPDRAELEARIQQRFATLPAQLQTAARYLLDHPAEVAMSSMRGLAQRAGVPHVTMLRLARQLDLADYEALRSVYREWVSNRTPGLSARGRALHERAGREARLLSDMLGADIELLHALDRDEATLRSLREAASAMLAARRCLVLGLRSLFAPAHYLAYSCGAFLPQVGLVTGLGGLRSDELRHLREGDALVVFSADPYARDTVEAVDQAHEAGATIVAITDSLASPVARHAATTVLFGNSSPSLFPSIVPAIALAQALVAMLIACSDDRVLQELAASEARLQRFAIYTQGGSPDDESVASDRVSRRTG